MWFDLIYFGASAAAAAFFCKLGGEFVVFGYIWILIRVLQFGEINTPFGARELEWRKDVRRKRERMKKRVWIIYDVVRQENE